MGTWSVVSPPDDPTPGGTQVGEHDTTAAPRLLAGRYLLLDEIGRGGMGVVWRAEDQVIGRLVAIKEMRLPDGLRPEEYREFSERALREARSAGRLNDPAVVTVFDILAAGPGGTGYLVMELIDAPTLAEVVVRHGPLPADRVAGVARQLLSALRVAHEAGVVHRDVKPANIMLLPDGRVKLTDFGIAQTLDDPRLTASGAVLGSPAYLAPERLQNGRATPASDLWSLGATLFFAVEGSGPYQRDTTAATVQAVLNEVPYLNRCQGPLASVIMGLLVRQPEGRLTTAQTADLLDRVGPAAATNPAAPALPLRGATRRETALLAPRRATGGALASILVGMLALVVAVALVGAGALLGAWTGDGGSGGSANLSAQGVLTYGSGGEVPEFGLGSGDCANGRPQAGRRLPSSSSLSCDEPHDIEVYTEDSLLSDEEFVSFRYPGEALDRWASSWCEAVFSSEYVTGEKDALAFTVLVPSEQAWSTPSGSSGPGTRSVYCVLQARDGSQLSESRIIET